MCVRVWFVLVSFFLLLRLLFGIVWPTYLCTYFFPFPSTPPIPSHSPTLVFAFAVGFLFWFLLNLLFDFFYLFCTPSRNLKLISFQVLFTFFFLLFLEHVSLITCTECNCIIVLLLLCLLWLMFYGAIHRHIWFICPRFCGI